MCRWGIAYANGPNINTAVSAAMATEAKNAILSALYDLKVEDTDNAFRSHRSFRQSAKLSDVNKAMLMAISERVSFSNVGEWTTKGQAFYDRKYADAMKKVHFYSYFDSRSLM